MRLITLLSFFVSLLTQAQWIQQTDFPAGARDDAVVLNTGGVAFIGTGRDAGFGLRNDFQTLQYGSLLSSWSPCAPLPASPRQYCTALGDESTLLFGGQDANGALNELWEYGPASNTWNQRSSLPDSGRSACAGFFHPNSQSAYVVGGILNDGSVSAQVWKYEYLNDAWTQLPDFPGTPRHRAMYGDNGIVAGGADSLFNPLAECLAVRFQQRVLDPTQFTTLPSVWGRKYKPPPSPNHCRWRSYIRQCVHR